MNLTTPRACAGLLACALAPAVQAAQENCAILADFSRDSLKIESTDWVPAGPDENVSQNLPAYCKVKGVLHERHGVNGVLFGDRFELRLPENWNHRFYFQGGGGTDGRVRPAVGSGQPNGQVPAVAQGFAVISTDAGHEDSDSSFGLDPQARRDWGYLSIRDVTETGKALTASYYGEDPRYSYLVGCSNGGRQGMVASQNYPDMFDGIAAGDPVFRMSRSHIDTAWGLQKLTAIAPKNENGHPILSRAFSDRDLRLLANDIVAQCDAGDGLKDGLVADPLGCDYDPSNLVCRPGQADGCMSAEKVKTLEQLHEGARDSEGNGFYVTWPYDPAMGTADWRKWRLGSSDKPVPNAIKAGLSNNAIKYVFLTPPDPDFNIIDFDFDFDKDPQRMEASADFADATSTDLSAFRDHGGKLLMYHGSGDAAISVNDTVRYMRALQNDMGDTEDFARLFVVPGMGHCRGGAGADEFDVLHHLVDWVEKGQAPNRLIATGSAIDDSSRPLCVWPKVARYHGSGPVSEASSFTCE